MKLVFDIEANGLLELEIKKGIAIPEADRIFCLCALDLDTGEKYSFTEEHIAEAVELLRSADLLIGHNIIGYDIPLLERLHGEINTLTCDTLIVSRLMYPDRKNHPFGGNSLRAWGEYLGYPKINYQGGFDKYCKDMLTYCKQDVIVTKEVFDEQQSFVKKYPASVRLEHKVARVIAQQIDNGIGFDVDAATHLEHDLLMEKVMIEDSMCDVFPPITEERWSDKTGKRLKDKITHFNPASRQQIASRLGTKYNWKPKLTECGNPKVDSGVLKELPYPEAKELVKYFDTIKLLGQVQDWILRAISSRDGRIHGSVNTQGTVTGRMTASQPNLQQVSGDPRARALFKPRDGWDQVGIDASGLEARLLANRMAKWDGGKYGQTVLNGDIHTHNQQAAGLETRDDAKTFFYALIYGAGDGKIGNIVGKNAKAGKEIKDKFLTEMPALKKLIDNCEFQVAKKDTISLLDGREVPCRAKHKALNVQIQGDGAIIMKQAQVVFHEMLEQMYPEQYSFLATVHDEWQIECDPSVSSKIGQLGASCIYDSGRKFNCLVRMDGDYKIGKNWSECH